MLADPIDATKAAKDTEPVATNDPDEIKKKQKKTWFPLLKDVRWQSAVALGLVHVLALYGILTFPFIQKFKTILWAYFVAMYTMFGINGGVHRYWCHRSYKATLPLKIILAYCYLSAAQTSFKNWVRHHRCHHRHMDTNGDPHNSLRGFFFSHIGWLMTKKTPETRENLKKIDMSDMEADPVIRFCDKNFMPLCLLVQSVSVLVPVYCWNETWHDAIAAQFIRYAWTLNAMFSINSVAHMWGYKPYDKHIAPVENRYASYVSFGEGWHNYHHTFPHDYRTPELGGPRFDVVAWWITFFSWIGWAYDLKTTSDNVVKMTMNRKGDGTFMKSASKSVIS